MPSVLLVLGGLAALCLPPGIGLAVPAVAVALSASRRRRPGWMPIAGLILLALAPGVPALRPAPGSGAPAGVRAVIVEGRYRAPPGGRPGLDTSAGRLDLPLASGVREPAPGQPIEAWLRVSPEGTSEAVAWRPTGPVSGAWLDRWARNAAARARQLVDRDDAGLLAALVLGQRDDLPWSLRAACAASGTAHVLSISGMHVALLASVLGVVAAAGSWRRSALLLAGFSALAGAAAPIARSYAGWLLAALALRRARPGDGLQRLAAVALLLEVWQPGLHHDLAAQLSFLAVAGLVAGARLVRGPAAALLAPLGAACATAPLCAETFGFVQPAGVLVTPFLTPPLALLLAASLLAVLPGPLLGLLDPLLAPLLQAALDLLQFVLHFAAEHGPAPWRPAPPPLPGVVLSLLVVAALVALGHARPGRAWESAA